MKARLREGAAFLAVGGTAFVLGAASLEALVRAGVSPYAAQVPALGLAILTTWMGNRRWTFRVDAPPTRREFLRYVGASLGGLVVNAATFSTLTYAGLPTTPAFAAATVAAMGFNFLGYKFAVFAR
ncbi:GtrA family protein [Sphingosinicella xenopeptidilytica]|uniref:GtrA family protein n=1 Tax=Sphingosinicella xenopeptidilytica TaxID=364098 RepID=A0ABW3C1H6_SPHXN